MTEGTNKSAQSKSGKLAVTGRKPTSAKQRHDAVMRRKVAAKRKQMYQDYLGKYFLTGGMPLSTDTYKRTMGEAGQYEDKNEENFTLGRTSYSLTPRRAMPETDQLIMAGHDPVQAGWFHQPLKRADLELALWYAKNESAVSAYPEQATEQLLAMRKGKRNIYLPIDIWGFPGGQAFPVKADMPKVPVSVAEAQQGAFWVSNIEPNQCQYAAHIQQATMARIWRENFPQDAEFGMRAAPNEIASISLIAARYVGSGGVAVLTSNDQAEMMLRDLGIKAIGTTGHEWQGHKQKIGRKLGEAELMATDGYVGTMKSGMILPDLINAESIGLLNALEILKRYPDATRVGIRIDSGDLPGQSILYHQAMKYVLHIVGRVIVVENEMTPKTAREIAEKFKAATGIEPTMIFPGAGGYWWKVHRDTVSMAFKRAATGDNGNVKFSNSPGKESYPGYLRVYGHGDKMVIGDVRENLSYESLFVQIVDDGKYVYKESFQTQAERSNETWGRYKSVELSPMVKETLGTYVQMREEESKEAESAIQDILRTIDQGRAAEGLAPLYAGRY